jgi:hypothetical protein
VIADQHLARELSTIFARTEFVRADFVSFDLISGSGSARDRRSRRAVNFGKGGGE